MLYTMMYPAEKGKHSFYTSVMNKSYQQFKPVLKTEIS